MLTEEIKVALKKNWGAKAEAMDCYAEVSFIDPMSSWQCYIYALNPEDDDTISCFFPKSYTPLLEWSLKELYASYNGDGEPLIIDPEYRRTRIDVLYKKMRGDQ